MPVPLAPLVTKTSLGKSMLQGAGMSAASGASSFLSDIFFGNRNYKRQRKAEERQWQRTLELRDYENKYNSPQEQMKRMIEAGLNPHLMYGQGTQSQPASRVDAPKGAIANTQFSSHKIDPLAAMGNIQQLNNMKAQERKTNAEADRIRALTPLDAGIKKDLRSKFGIEIANLSEHWKARINEINANIEQKEAQTAKIEEEKKRITQEVLTEIQKTRKVSGEADEAELRGRISRKLDDILEDAIMTSDEIWDLWNNFVFKTTSKYAF